MSKIHYEFVIIPYRDQYFLHKFGWTVRDLMIIKTLSESKRIDKITVLNRPVSIYERLTTKQKIKDISYGKIKFIDVTSCDLIGPLYKRSWTENCYRPLIEHVAKNTFSSSNKIVVLDFTPIAKIDYSLFNNAFVWYDLIDNFTKHNRFNRKQKQLVKQKYKYIEKKASMLTGVTSAAIEQFERKDKMAIINGLLSYAEKQTDASSPEFAFGFVGFITDKLDFDFLIRLANISLEQIAVFGRSYDKKIDHILKKNTNIKLFGEFNENQLHEIMNKFEIGLIPYQEKKSHDGSPIKLYQYFNYGVPVVCTQNFEDNLMRNKYVRVVNPKDIFSVLQFLQHIRIDRKKNGSIFKKKVKNQIDVSVLWSSKINFILNKLDKLN